MPHPERLDPYGLLRGRVDSLNGMVEYALSGELDLAAADDLRDRLVDLAQDTRGDLRLNLADLDFLGSTGIRVLFLVHADLAEEGRRLVLLNVTGSPYRALELTGLLGELNLE